jgi:polysaccharide biosynthesis/export protein PslD
MTPIHGVVVRRLLAVAIALSLVLPFVSARGAAPSDQTPIDEIDWGQTPEYRIVPGDELELDFGPREAFDSHMINAVVVRPDGRITVYPVGDVVAAGRTPVELQGQITGLLAGVYRTPRMTVEVTKSAANRIHVLGRVKKPGAVAAGALPTLMQALSEVGGFEDDAARSSVIVMRRVGLGSVVVTRVRVDRLLRSGGDMPLSRFDIVYVPRSSIGNLNVFVTEFFNPLTSVGTTAMLGWELFNLDKVFQYRVAGIR